MIDNMVYGHAQAKRVLSVLLKRSRERYHRKCVLGLDTYPESLKCLLIGPSGTGKTHLIHSMKKLHNFPLLSIDATQLTPSGNTDGINSKQLVSMIKKTAHEYTKEPEFHSIEGVLNQLVIFVDEFDKLGTSFDSSGSWNQHVQANFLTLIDHKEEFAGISWVFAGAFSCLHAAKTASVPGFFPDTSNNKSEITDKDILKAGIIPEMLGRISLIVQLDTFTRADYKTVLIERLLPNYPNLEPDYKVIDEIVDKAIASGLGIRSLTRQLEMLAIESEYESLTENKPDIYRNR